MRVLELAGERFGRWRVIGRAPTKQGYRESCWLCVCNCGTQRVVAAGALRKGASTGCGCVPARNRLTHGGRHTAEYGIWTNMLTRCGNPRNKAFRRYGGRGITVCERWRNDFAAFLADMGPRPSPKHSVDRINNDGDYEPSNCRWATTQEQCRNTRRNVRLTLDGRTMTQREWAVELGIHDSTLFGRIKRNGALAALTAKKRTGNYRRGAA